MYYKEQQTRKGIILILHTKILQIPFETIDLTIQQPLAIELNGIEFNCVNNGRLNC